MVRHYLINLLVSLLLLSGCSMFVGPDNTELCILFTTDVQGNVMPYDFQNSRADDASLASFSSLVNEQRAIYGNRCLVFDNGNKLNGSPSAFYYTFADTVSEPLAYRAERLLRYDAVGLGFHDPENSECLNPRRHNPMFQPPTICANLIDRHTGEPVFLPYMTFVRSGIRITILGMMSPAVSEWLPLDVWHDVDVQDMIECASHWVPIIKEQENPDVIIGLFNCGAEYEKDGHDLNTYKNPNGGIPAAIRVPGIDLVLLGGSTTPMVKELRNEAGERFYVMQTQPNCTKAGQIRLHLIKKNGHYEKHAYCAEVDLSQYEPDPVFTHYFSDARDSIYIWFNRPIGQLQDPIYGGKGLYGPDFYRDFINTAQLWYTKADISMAPLLLPKDTIEAGTLTMKRIFEIYPAEHSLQILSMSGEEVRRYLEWSCQLQFEQMKKGSDPMLALLKDRFGHIIYNEKGQPHLRNNPTNYTSAGGIHYTVDFRNDVGNRVTIVSWPDGRPFDLRGQYRVAINSYQLQDGGHFISKGLHWDHEELALHAIPTSPNSVRQILFNYVQRKDTVRFNYDYEWTPLPLEYWQSGRVREQDELNPIW